jgi:hypothetical protein
MQFDKDEQADIDKTLGIVRKENGEVNITATRKAQKTIFYKEILKKDQKKALSLSPNEISEQLEIFYKQVNNEYEEKIREIPPHPLEIISFLGVSLTKVRNMMYDPRLNDERGVNVLEEAITNAINELYTYSLHQPKVAQSVMFMMKSMFPELFSEKYEIHVNAHISHSVEVRNLTDKELIDEIKLMVNQLEDNKTISEDVEYEVK